MTKSPSEKWLTALAPAEAQQTNAKRPVSTRISEGLFLSLESMAKVLGKAPARLHAEILEAAIYDFSHQLEEHRRDLLEQLDDAEQVGPNQWTDTRPTWLTPEQGEAQAMSYRAVDPAAPEETA